MPVRLPRVNRYGAWAIATIWLACLACLWWTTTAMPSHLASNILATYLLAWGGIALVARPPAHELRIRFALMTGAFGCALVFLELLGLVGVVDWTRVFPVPLVDRPHEGRDVPDPELLHIHRPHLRESGWTRGDLLALTHLAGPSHRYDVRYDQNGFRNSIDLARAEIAVVGDSFIEGGLVPAEQLITSMLGRLQHCTAANLGQAKYGPQQELAVLRRYAVPMVPRICIWAFFEGNDLSEIARYRRIRSQGSSSHRPRAPLVDRSFTKNALSAVIRVSGFDRSLDIERIKHSGLLRTSRDGAVRLFFHYPGLPLSARDRGALDDLISILTSAADLCERNRVRLVIVFIPTKYRVYRDNVRFDTDSPCQDWERNDLPESLRARVSRISPEIGFVDLTGPFRDRADGGALLYYPDDTHWSPEGHAFAAQILDEYLATTPRIVDSDPGEFLKNHRPAPEFPPEARY